MTMPDATQVITQNLTEISERVATAALSVGRSPDAITLVAVCKYVSADVAAALVEADCRDLGESRPQQLWEKTDDSRLRNARWHLVGHLQRNKLRRTLPLVDLIHAVDSDRLLNAIEKESHDQDLKPRVLLEFNCSGDPEKHGFSSSDADGLADRVATLERTQVAGLMTMAPRDRDLDAARRTFAELRRLRDAMQSHCPENLRLDELSMGMSGDFEPAIAEGATMVRIGSALFKGLL